jgi:DNA invertase Pin-like site-specific DNA recombinase
VVDRAHLPAKATEPWYQLLDLCALTDTLIADADGVYHPGGFNDRLVLGLKGTMSEAELHLIRSRLTAGLKHNAAKGELRQGCRSDWTTTPTTR